MADSPASLLVDIAGRISSLDAFGRLRVSQPSSLFDSKQIYDNVPLFFVTDVVNGGVVSHVLNRSTSSLSVTTTTGSRAIRQTKRYFNYQPGKSLLINATFSFIDQLANIRRRVGYFDADDGVYLQQLGAAVLLVKRSTVNGVFAEDVQTQASWNLDKMDGTGPSGITLDLTKAQILVVDMQWLGAGVLATGLSIEGVIHYVHAFKHANIVSNVYMRTPNLPVRWEIENVGSLVAATMDSTCCSIMVEGGVEPLGFTRSADRGVSGQTVNNTLEPIISIRLKASHNRATTLLKKISVMSSTNANLRWALLLNPTVTGGSVPSWTSVIDSAMEFDVARNGTASAGHQLDSSYSSNNADLSTSVVETALIIGSNFSGAQDELVLCAHKIGGGTEKVFGGLTWLEAL